MTASTPAPADIVGFVAPSLDLLSLARSVQDSVRINAGRPRINAGRPRVARIPDNFRPGRTESGIGVAYRNFIPAAQMPFATSTRQLGAGFVVLSDQEAAKIALGHLPVYEAWLRSEIDTCNGESPQSKYLLALTAKLDALPRLAAKYDLIAHPTTSQEDAMTSTTPTPVIDAPSQDDVDAAVVQLADELNGTVAPATRKRRAAAALPSASDAAKAQRKADAPALAERKRLAAEAKAKRDAAVEARAVEVAAEQAAAPPVPPKKKVSSEASIARKAEQSARIAKVIEMRAAGAKLSEIAAECGYATQQVVSGVIKRHAPELQTPKASSGLTLTPSQYAALFALVDEFGDRVLSAAYVRAMARFEAAEDAALVAARGLTTDSTPA